MVQFNIMYSENNKCVLYFFILLLLPSYDFQKNNIGLPTNEFGPYVLHNYQMNICKGQRDLNVTRITSNIIKTPDNKIINKMNATFYASIALEETKIEVYKQSKGVMVLVYRHKVKNLCSHFAAMELMRRLYNTDRRCIIAKGTYISEYNVSDQLASYLGTNYFYGTFMLKVNVNSRKGNIFCAHIIMSLAKKT